jgi:tRNA A-37 threonylcarbamoyl transferase component Bud32
VADETSGRRAKPGGGGDISLTEVPAGRGEVIDPDLDLGPAFNPGDLIAQRYEVEGFLARGGMGEVYRVHDRELGESVALKTILPKALNDPTTLDRFRREIQIARRVSHRNVCRIFDLGRHPTGDGDDVVFLTMELLQGVSLRARLADGGLSPGDAMEVVRQLCDGLSAAHGQGIIHRDLKPSNIFLVPEEHGDRVVIADFGLARRESLGDEDLTVTRTGELLGTPAYMAPEQMEGLEATTASDIYALGLVIYELLTGARPFEGSSAFQMALNKMREKPSGPSSLVRGVPAHWDDVVLRCLETDPADRFERVEEIAVALSDERALGRAVNPANRRRMGYVVAAGMLLAAVSLAGLKIAGVLDRRPVVPAPQQHEARAPVESAVADVAAAVSVLGFENLTGNPAAAGVSDDLCRLIGDRLVVPGVLTVGSLEDVRRVRSELKIDRLTTLGPEDLSRLRERLDADFVVLGSYAVFTDEGTVRLDARIQDIEADEILIVPTVKGPAGDLDAVADDAAIAIRSILGFDEAVPEEVE